MSDDLAAAVQRGDRAALARAVTLVESSRADHRDAARQLLRKLRHSRTNSVRVGMSGVPGAGKSTFIDELGTQLLSEGHRVAVLAVDPSSARSGGSILGDKTRMQRLALSENAFVRPSPTGGTLGGVARATREAIVLVEAAGYDVVLVETVGVGQSEYVVADMVDAFCLLALARSGDELQGIKRGILELADVVAVNKADGPHRPEAEHAAGELRTALRLLRGDEAPSVLTCSALTGDGVQQVWWELQNHRERLGADGLLARRRRQEVTWLEAMIRDRLLAPLADPQWQQQAAAVRAEVESGALAVEDALDRLVPLDPTGRSW